MGLLALWYSKLSHCLRHLHPMWALVQLLAAPLPIWLPAKAPRKAVEDGPVIDPYTHGGDLVGVPGSWVQPLSSFEDENQ